MIELEFLTDDPDEIELGQRYWQFRPNGKFKERTEEVVAFDSRGIVRDLGRDLFPNVIARDTCRRCPTCGIPQVVSNRESFLAPLTPKKPCTECLCTKQHLARSMWARSAGTNERCDAAAASHTRLRHWRCGTYSARLYIGVR